MTKRIQLLENVKAEKRRQHVQRSCGRNSLYVFIEDEQRPMWMEYGKQELLSKGGGQRSNGSGSYRALQAHCQELAFYSGCDEKL